MDARMLVTAVDSDEHDEDEGIQPPLSPSLSLPPPFPLSPTLPDGR